MEVRGVGTGEEHTSVEFLAATVPRRRLRGEPGVVSRAPVTQARIDLAKSLFAQAPSFWGRSLGAPDSDLGASGSKPNQPSASEFVSEEEAALLAANGIRVLPVARQSARVYLGRAEGLSDGEANAREIVTRFGEAYLAKEAPELFVFLAIEPGSSLSSEYFAGWAAGLGCASAKVTIHPCVCLARDDRRTLRALRAAAAEGAFCKGLWVTSRPDRKKSVWSHALGPFRDADVALPEPAPCKVLLFQYADGYHGDDGFDCLSTHPDIDLSADLLDYLAVPRAKPQEPAAPPDPSRPPAPAEPDAPQVPRHLSPLAQFLGSPWSPIVFLGIPLSMLGAGLIPRLRGGRLWALEAVLLATFLALVGVAVAGRPLGVLVNAQKRMSLSRFQIVLWTVILLSAYVTIVAMRMGQPNPLDVEIDWRLWALMGISTGTLVATPLLQREKREAGLLRANRSPGDAWLSDMFGGDDRGSAPAVDLTKMQMFCLTLVAAASYGVSLFRLIEGTDPAAITSLPALGDGFLAIIGLSHAGYLAGKLTRALPVAEAEEETASIDVEEPAAGEPAKPVEPAPAGSEPVVVAPPVVAEAPRLAVPPRPAGALTGSAFFAKLGDARGAAREELALKELLDGNIPDFLRELVEVKLSHGAHTASVWVSPDVLAIGSNEDFVRMPLSPLTAQQVHDVYRTTFVTNKLALAIHAQAEVKLAPIDQTAWHPYKGAPGEGMLTNAFFLEHNKRVEQARAGARLGALVSSVKKDVLLSIKLKRVPSRGQLGKKAVVIYGWFGRDGRPIQPESDVHENTYVDYSHGIRLVSTDMIVDGEPRSLFDVMEDKELAGLLLKAQDIQDSAFPPPRRYAEAPRRAPYEAPAAGAPNRASILLASARIELDRGTKKHGKGKAWAVTPNSGPIVDDYQRSAGILDASGRWRIEPGSAPWCGNFCGFHHRQAGFDMESELPARLNVTGLSREKKKVIFWSAARLDHYFRERPCERLEMPYRETHMTREQCIAWLKEKLHPFGLRPGDVLLVTTQRGPMAHVAMVASYDPEKMELVTYEGNYARRGAALRWDLSQPGIRGFHRIDVIGRFPAEDFVTAPALAANAQTPDPEIEAGSIVYGRHEEDGPSAPVEKVA